MSCNILEETDTIASMANLRTKLNFLEEEKIRLEQIISEMQQQIRLQRHINHELSKTSKVQENQAISSLTNQNKCLEGQYLRIKNQNQQLSSTLLIHQQLMNQNQMEFESAFRSYQEKIIELRRSIQLKESYIQNMEAKYKVLEERIIVPTNNVTMLFYNEIEELKNSVSTISIRNRQLQLQNKAVLGKNEQVEKKLRLLQSLTLTSKLTYEEMKNYYCLDHQKARNSAPKKGVYIPLNERLQNQLSIKKMNEAQTRQCTEVSFPPFSTPFKMLVYKQTQQIQKLKAVLTKTTNQLSVERQAKSKLAVSFSQQHKKLTLIMEELNYYKRATKEMMNIIAYKHHNQRPKSLERLKNQKIIDSIKLYGQVDAQCSKKKLWEHFKSGVKIEKINLLKIKRKYQGFYRSLSSVVDYRQTKIDEEDEYLKKDRKWSNKKRQMQRQSGNQFSMMMDTQFLDNISFIEGGSHRMNFGQWKKQGKQDALLNLTIFQEGVL